MTELQKLRQAMLTMEALSRDPLASGQMDGVLCDPATKDCFLYVAGLLRQIIENDGVVQNAGQAEKADFFLAPDTLAALPVSPTPVTAGEIAGLVNAQTDPMRMRRLPAAAIQAWLNTNGFLAEATDADGVRRKTPTVRGNRIGVTSEQRHGARGAYTAVLYDENAQRFVLGRLSEMTAWYREKIREIEE
ncbi:MAG: hypothetical protein AAGU77_04235 [Bacillota bacterium]